MRKNLQDARKSAGLTQDEVAEKIGVSTRQYQRLESGSSNGSFRHWDALEDLLGVHQRTLREIQDKYPSPGESP